MSALIARDELRTHLRRYLAWLDDAETPAELRSFACHAVATTLRYLADEAAITDVLVVLRRGVERRDDLATSLVYNLPRVLDDGRPCDGVALLPLGNHALARGALDALLHIACASLWSTVVAVPAAWIVALIQAESQEQPRELLISLVEDWLERETDRDGGDADPVGIALCERPNLHAKLFCPASIPF